MGFWKRLFGLGYEPPPPPSDDLIAVQADDVVAAERIRLEALADLAADKGLRGEPLNNDERIARSPSAIRERDARLAAERTARDAALASEWTAQTQATLDADMAKAATAQVPAVAALGGDTADDQPAATIPDVAASESAPSVVPSVPPRPARRFLPHRRALWFLSDGSIAPGATVEIRTRFKHPLAGGVFVVDEVAGAIVPPSFLVELSVDFAEWSRRFQLGALPGDQYAHGKRIPMGRIAAEVDFVVRVHNAGTYPARFAGVLLGRELVEVTLADVQQMRARQSQRQTCTRCDGAGEVVLPGPPPEPAPLSWPDDVTAPPIATVAPEATPTATPAETPAATPPTETPKP